MTDSVDIKIDDNQTKLINQKWYMEWRTLAAWTYLIICLHDFLIAPELTMIISSLFKIPYTPWIPLTLGGGGFFHIAFLGIIGVSAWGKGQETSELIKNMPDYSNAVPKP